jgi:hypothetical protein
MKKIVLIAMRDAALFSISGGTRSNTIVHWQIAVRQVNFDSIKILRQNSNIADDLDK